MNKSKEDLLVNELILLDENTKLKAAAKILASIMLDRKAIGLKSKSTFGNCVSIIINSELKEDENRLSTTQRG